jgi:hypothetical protein
LRSGVFFLCVWSEEERAGWEEKEEKEEEKGF